LVKSVVGLRACSSGCGTWNRHLIGWALQVRHSFTASGAEGRGTAARLILEPLIWIDKRKLRAIMYILLYKILGL